MPSARVTCPHCHAKLRLSTEGGAPTRAKCRTCGKTFEPVFTEPVQGSALYLDASVHSKPLQPLTPFSTPPPPSPAPVLQTPPPAVPPPPRPAPVRPPEPAAPLFEFSSSSPAAVAAPPAPPPPKVEPRRIEPEVVAPPAPPGIVEEPLAEPEVLTRSPAPAAVLAPPPPAPKVVAPPAPRSAPPPAPPKAAPKRKVEKIKRKDGGIEDFSRERLRPFEIALGIFILLAAAGGGVLLWYQYSGPSGPPAAADSSDDEAKVVDETSTPDAAAMVDLEPGQKTRPPELIGTWSLRADDGRVGNLVLDADGNLIASSSNMYGGDKPLDDYVGHWYFISHTNDQYTLEFGTVWRGPDSYRVVLEMTGPDALTLVETVKNGAPVRDQHRFIRVGPPTKKTDG